MTATNFKRGEIVDITIKGVRILDEDEHGCVAIAAEAHDGGPANWPLPPQAVIERVAPAQWPPQPGDVWREEDTLSAATWFAQRYYADCDNEQDYKDCNSEGWRLVLIPMNGGPYGVAAEVKPEDLIRKVRLTLVHREQQAQAVVE